LLNILNKALMLKDENVNSSQILNISYGLLRIFFRDFK